MGLTKGEHEKQRRLRSIKRKRVSFVVTVLEPANPDLDDAAANIFADLAGMGAVHPVSVIPVYRDSDLNPIFDSAGYKRSEGKGAN